MRTRFANIDPSGYPARFRRARGETDIIRLSEGRVPGSIPGERANIVCCCRHPETLDPLSID